LSLNRVAPVRGMELRAWCVVEEDVEPPEEVAEEEKGRVKFGKEEEREVEKGRRWFRPAMTARREAVAPRDQISVNRPNNKCEGRC
jgi:hypothetical protein